MASCNQHMDCTPQLLSCSVHHSSLIPEVPLCVAAVLNTSGQTDGALRWSCVPAKAVAAQVALHRGKEVANLLVLPKHTTPHDVAWHQPLPTTCTPRSAFHPGDTPCQSPARPPITALSSTSTAASTASSTVTAAATSSTHPGTRRDRACSSSAPPPRAHGM
jgi:hypothetical protein